MGNAVPERSRSQCKDECSFVREQLRANSVFALSGVSTTTATHTINVDKPSETRAVLLQIIERDRPDHEVLNIVAASRVRAA